VATWSPAFCCQSAEVEGNVGIEEGATVEEDPVVEEDPDLHGE